MKLVGYAIPPCTIIDFLPIIYQKGRNYYATIGKNHKIIKFRKVSNNIQVQKIKVELSVAKGDNAFYCYQFLEGKIVTGDFLSVSSKLLPYLSSEKINNYAKLSLAIFFNLFGIQKRIIKKIREKEASHNNYGIYEVSGSVTIIKAKKELRILINQLNGWQEYIKQYSRLSWYDIIWIEDNFIYIEKCKISIKLFQNEIPNAQFILKAYLKEIPYNARVNLIIQNSELFLISLEEDISIVKDTDIKEEFKEIISSPYNMENALIFTIQKKRINIRVYTDVSNEHTELKNELKQLSGKFKDMA